MASSFFLVLQACYGQVLLVLKRSRELPMVLLTWHVFQSSRYRTRRPPQSGRHCIASLLLWLVVGCLSQACYENGHEQSIVLMTSCLPFLFLFSASDTARSDRFLVFLLSP